MKPVVGVVLTVPFGAKKKLLLESRSAAVVVGAAAAGIAAY